MIPQQQTGGLPHAQIYDLEVKVIQNGYELWISCASRGIAVLTVINDNVGISNPVTAEPVLFLQNYPNPFKGETSISFSLPEDGFVNISVYDINGKVIRDLAGKFYPSGTSAIIWNGDDNQGRPVKRGIYVCRLIAGDVSKSIRMVVK